MRLNVLQMNKDTTLVVCKICDILTWFQLNALGLGYDYWPFSHNMSMHHCAMICIRNHESLSLSCGKRIVNQVNFWRSFLLLVTKTKFCLKVFIEVFSSTQIFTIQNDRYCNQGCYWHFRLFFAVKRTRLLSCFMHRRHFYHTITLKKYHRTKKIEL